MMKIFAIFRILIIHYKTLLLKKKFDNDNGKIYISDSFLGITIIKEKGSKLFITGTLKFIRHLGGKGNIWIYLSENSTLQIDGDFIIGNGVRIFLSKNSKLYFGGKSQESESGITENSKIMVYNSINIGKDFLCAWDVFISDSDWHSTFRDSVLLKNHTIPVTIGDHVWIGHGCSILKGTKIGDGSIIGSKSLLSNNTFPENSLIAGMPAKVIVENNVNWTRDIIHYNE